MCDATYTDYGNCPKNSYSKVSDKMTYANSAGPDKTYRFSGAVRSGSTIFAIPFSILQKEWNKVL